MIYELLGIKDSNDNELELRAEDGQLSDMTWAASDCFEGRDIAGQPNIR